MATNARSAASVLFHARVSRRHTGWGCGRARAPGCRPRPLSGEFVVILVPPAAANRHSSTFSAGSTPDERAVQFREHRLVGASERELTQYARTRRVRVPVLQPHPSLTARENVELVTEIATSRCCPMKRCETSAGRAARPLPAQLSAASSSGGDRAGDRKRPDVLLCDEPTARWTRKRPRGPGGTHGGERDAGDDDGRDHAQRADRADADRVLRMRSGRIVEETRNAAKRPPGGGVVRIQPLHRSSGAMLALSGQLAAIIAVVTCGIALFVTMRSMNGFLRDSRDSYYAQYRFADIFAQVRRAPARAAREVALLRGWPPSTTGSCSTCADVPGLAEPAVPASCPSPCSGAGAQ